MNELLLGKNDGSYERFALEMLDKPNCDYVDMNKIKWILRYYIWRIFKK